jgi:hypothetical protein
MLAENIPASNKDNVRHDQLSSRRNPGRSTATVKLQWAPDGSSETEYVMPPLNEYDIVCGRSKGSFNNIGNRRFRVTIEINLEAYKAATTKKLKSHLIARIAAMLREDVGARFLEPKGKGFIGLTEKETHRKIGHALRDTAFTRSQSNGSSSPPLSLDEVSRGSNNSSPLEVAKPVVKPHLNKSNRTASIMTTTEEIYSYADDDDARADSIFSTSSNFFLEFVEDDIDMLVPGAGTVQLSEEQDFVIAQK